MFKLASMVVIKVDARYNCVKAGRFPDAGDREFRRYYLCVPRGEDGHNFEDVGFVCPKGTIFNNDHHQCYKS